jgi:hypothetical protein
MKLRYYCLPVLYTLNITSAYTGRLPLFYIPACHCTLDVRWFRDSNMAWHGTGFGLCVDFH